MPSGVAVRVGGAPTQHFDAHASVYRVHPAVLKNGERVHAVLVGAKADTAQPCTTVFHCPSDGEMLEILEPWQRIPARDEHESALANLGEHGYLVIEPQGLTRLRTLGEAQALAFALESLGNTLDDAESYARAHWGVFAARHLVESYERYTPVRSVWAEPVPA
jgi:hypothetical protein